METSILCAWCRGEAAAGRSAASWLDLVNLWGKTAKPHFFFINIEIILLYSLSWVILYIFFFYYNTVYIYIYLIYIYIYLIGYLYLKKSWIFRSIINNWQWIISLYKLAVCQPCVKFIYSWGFYCLEWDLDPETMALWLLQLGFMLQPGERRQKGDLVDPQSSDWKLRCGWLQGCCMDLRAKLVFLLVPNLPSLQSVRPAWPWDPRDPRDPRKMCRLFDDRPHSLDVDWQGEVIQTHWTGQLPTAAAFEQCFGAKGIHLPVKCEDS